MIADKSIITLYHFGHLGLIFAPKNQQIPARSLRSLLQKDRQFSQWIKWTLRKKTWNDQWDRTVQTWVPSVAMAKETFLSPSLSLSLAVSLCAENIHQLASLHSADCPEFQPMKSKWSFLFERSDDKLQKQSLQLRWHIPFSVRDLRWGSHFFKITFTDCTSDIMSMGTYSSHRPASPMSLHVDYGLHQNDFITCICCEHTVKVPSK